MPDPNGFLKYERQLPKARPIPVRLQDWREVYKTAPVIPRTNITQVTRK